MHRPGQVHRGPLRSRARTVAAAVALGVLVALTTAGPAAAGRGGSPAPVVATSSGTVRGQVHDGAEEFLGIPYAAPPVGDRRFRAPRPHARWSGVREATTQGPACVQFAAFGIDPAQPRSEDCLNLDVYRPRGTRPGAVLPVVLWIHGGGFVQGTGTQFAGRAMADDYNVIIVSINYRLGALGYLGLPGFDAETPEGSGNWGLLDQIAALRWIKDNAKAFGGNPRNVTVTGQSAGSGSVCGILASPLASGLAAKAVLQSGPCTLLAARSRADAQAQGTAFATGLGCPDPATAAACLRAVPAAALTAAGMQLPVPGLTSGVPALPVDPAAAIGSGHWNKMPVLIGSTRSEGRMFALDQVAMTPDQYPAYLARQYGPLAPEVLARYPLSAYASPYHAVSAIVGDASFICQTSVTAELLRRQVPTYRYEFDDPESPPLVGLDLPGLDMGNAHSAELAYLFDFTMQARPFTAQQAAMADRMKHAWAAFAWTSTPNAWGLTLWPPLTARGEVLKFRPAGDIRFRSFDDEHHCGFWNSSAAPGR
ncbi:carboxylesterase/lipase family protein [Streptodolium elevatio]|uniref:Carboxylic ester hydrolase n=1 Tax=Streptodolium elevatio TaxID=3157996 RepID=A0ABV3DY80_9ACTN